MSVILRKRKNADGTTSLRLDIYSDGKRKIITLKHLQLAKASGIVDRENNRVLLQQAEAIRRDKAVELEGNNYNLNDDSGKKTEVAIWMQNYVDSYTKKDIRNMQGVLNRFSTFLKEQKKTGLTFGDLNALLIEDFIDYLQSRSTGEGARSYYNRFKKMLKNSYRKKLLRENILDHVEKKAKGKAKKKDTLTLEDLKLLAATDIKNQEVRRAALFCSVTGLAWVDVKGLTWDKIKLETRKLEMVRAKLKDENRTITIDLNDTALKILGAPQNGSERVFNLPTANGANKTLKAWVARAGIDKKFTWHQLRHSAATNLILTGTDILSTSQLMGHSSTTQTMRYVRAAEELKRKGMDKLNFEI